MPPRHLSAGVTDVMSTYPDEDEFEPTVALADDDDFDFNNAEGESAAPEAEVSEAQTSEFPAVPGAEGPPGTPGREAEDVPVDPTVVPFRKGAEA